MDTGGPAETITTTVHNCYPLPSILDLSNKLQVLLVHRPCQGLSPDPYGSGRYSENCYSNSFWSFRISFMPFGLRNAAHTFQWFMDKIFRHLPFIFTYLDDHLIASRTLEEHLDHLRQLFTVLQENSLQINPAKCVFGASAVEFLGQSGSTWYPPSAAAHHSHPGFSTTTGVKQLQQFLGMVNFYRRFLPSIAKVLLPLTEGLKGSPKMLLWLPAAAATAFEVAKAALVAAVPLAHPAPHAVLSSFCSNSRAVHGRRSPSFQISCQGRACGIPPSTGSSSPPSAPSVTAGSCWRVTSLACLRITSRWSLPFSAPPTPGVQNIVADALSRPPPPTIDPPASAAPLPAFSATAADAFPSIADEWPDEAFDASHPPAPRPASCTHSGGGLHPRRRG
jgi:hypothetical protein